MHRGAWAWARVTLCRGLYIRACVRVCACVGLCACVRVCVPVFDKLAPSQAGVMASVGPGILLPILSPQSCVMDAALLAAAILCKGAVQAAKADPRLRDVVAAQGGEVVGATLALEGQPAVLVHQLDSFVHLWSLAPLIPVRDAVMRTRHRMKCVPVCARENCGCA